MTLRDIVLFAHTMSGIQLRDYQIGPARAIVESVRKRDGMSFVVIFPRQSGKNELQAQIEAYILFVLQQYNAGDRKSFPDLETAIDQRDAKIGANT